MTSEAHPALGDGSGEQRQQQQQQDAPPLQGSGAFDALTLGGSTDFSAGIEQASSRAKVRCE
jgi:hypothetical protein